MVARAQAPHLHCGVQTTHSRKKPKRLPRHAGGVGALLRREGLVLVAAGLLGGESRANGILRSVDSSDGAGRNPKRNPLRRRKSEAAPPGCAPIDRRSPQGPHHHRRPKKSRGAVGEPASGTRTRTRNPDGRGHRTRDQPWARSAACRALCDAASVPLPAKAVRLIGSGEDRSAAFAGTRTPAPAEREAVLARLHGERFQDRSPAAVYATLLDEGEPISARFAPCIACSNEQGEVRGSAAIS